MKQYIVTWRDALGLTHRATFFTKEKAEARWRKLRKAEKAAASQRKKGVHGVMIYAEYAGR